MIRLACFVTYIFASLFALAFLGMGDWGPWAQFGATTAVMITSTWILPGYFYRGDPLPTRKPRRPHP